MVVDSLEFGISVVTAFGDEDENSGYSERCPRRIQMRNKFDYLAFICYFLKEMKLLIRERIHSVMRRAILDALFFQ